jgi:molecular chaperone GrpE
VGDHFDPAVHEAVQFETSTEVSEPTVTAVFRSGYTLGERLVRPAVVVVTGPEHESAATADEPIVAAEAFGSASAGAPGDAETAADNAGGAERPA